MVSVPPAAVTARQTGLGLATVPPLVMMPATDDTVPAQVAPAPNAMTNDAVSTVIDTSERTMNGAAAAVVRPATVVIRLALDRLTPAPPCAASVIAPVAAVVPVSAAVPVAAIAPVVSSDSAELSGREMSAET